MTKTFFRTLLLALGLISQFFFAQEYPDGLSDGKLNINQKEIPVKIFSTIRNSTLQGFADNKVNDNVLIILNKANLEYSNEDFFRYNESILNTYQVLGYQLLDKKFQPYKGDITHENILTFKYIYKGDEIKSGDQVALKTEFSIWDPSTSIGIGSFRIHYYSLMFVIAFGLGYVLMSRFYKIDGADPKFVDPLFTYTLLGTIFGARLGHVIFYQPELFKQDFWSVFLPIRTVPEFEFTGFSGLASHGATIALLGTTLYYSIKVIKKNPLWVYDRIGIVVALAGFFIRFGNFFNSEIIGKPVSPDSPFAILFPQMSDEYGVTVPRYPTQLFEAFGYLGLFIILWFLYHKTDKKYQQGWLFGFFFMVLWSIRFLVEFLKEPQGEEFINTGVLNTGQLLSIPLFIIGIIVMFISKKYKIAKN